MSIKLIDRGIMNTTRQGYTLNTNPLTGFKNAINNGQTRLALEYAEVLIDQLMSRVASLEEGTPKAQVQAVQAEDVVEVKEKTPRQRKQVSDKDTAE